MRFPGCCTFSKRNTLSTTSTLGRGRRPWYCCGRQSWWTGRSSPACPPTGPPETSPSGEPPGPGPSPSWEPRRPTRGIPIWRPPLPPSASTRRSVGSWPKRLLLCFVPSDRCELRTYGSGCGTPSFPRLTWNACQRAPSPLAERLRGASTARRAFGTYGGGREKRRITQLLTLLPILLDTPRFLTNLPPPCARASLRGHRPEWPRYQLGLRLCPDC